MESKSQLNPEGDSGRPLQQVPQQVDMNRVQKGKQEQTADLYYLPAYCRLNISGISKISYANRTALLKCQFHISINIDGLKKDIVNELIKEGIRLSFNIDEKVVDLKKKNINVTLEKTDTLLYFTAQQFIHGKLRMDNMLYSPFNLIYCEIDVRLNRAKLKVGSKKFGSLGKNNKEQKNGYAGYAQKEQTSKLSRKRSKQNQQKNKKKIEIHFNLMDLKDRTSTQEKIQCQPGCSFGEFFIAFSQLNAHYSNQSVHIHEKDGEYKQKNYCYHGFREDEKQIIFQNEHNFQEQAFLIPEKDQILRKDRKQRSQSFDFAHFTIPLYKKPMIALQTIFIPLLFLGLLNLGIFFQQGNLHKRIVSIGGLILGFVSLIPPIKQQMPPIPKISIIELIVFFQSLTTLLALFQSLKIGDNQEFKIEWQKDSLFLAAAIISVINLVGVIILIILYFIWSYGYNQGKERYEDAFKEEIVPDLWQNTECNRVFGELNKLEIPNPLTSQKEKKQTSIDDDFQKFHPQPSFALS